MLSLKIQSSSQTAHRSARPGPVREGRAGARLRARGAASTERWRASAAPESKKGPLGPYENANALHERNGLSSHGLHRSTFGDGELNCRVRHGTG